MSGSSSNAERAAIVLLVLGESGLDGMALRELAQTLGEAKPALHRTLKAMIRHGFVEQPQGRGNYRLGPAIFALSRRESSAAERVRRWRPTLIELGERLGCTMFLMMRSGMDAVVLDMHVGSSPVQLMTSGVGGRLPLGAGPGSSAILAMQDEPVREQVMAANAVRYCKYGVEPELVRSMVDDAIRRGHSVSRGDIHPDAGGVGVPLIERDGSCVAAITASTVVPHLTPENFARLVAEIEAAVRRGV